jgi:hypothetical protein
VDQAWTGQACAAVPEPSVNAFEPNLITAVDALGVDREQNLDGVTGPFGDLGGWDARVQLRTNDEVTGFQWASPAEIKAMATEAYAVRVLDALNSNGPAVRQHDGVHLV